MSQPSTNKSLGRGLAALLGSDPSSEASLLSESNSVVSSLSIQELAPGRYQPREIFDQDYLDSLIASIKEKGVIQPILVRPVKQGLANFEIVAGERRWKAAQIAGLKFIPAIIKSMTDLEALETGLIENIQRHDLNPLEEAQGFKRLMDEFKYTQEDLAKSLGKSRSHIANSVRLLNLQESVKEALKNGKISTGHARALVNCENQQDYLRKIIRNGLNVRQTEKLVHLKPQKIKENKTILIDIEENHDEINSLVQKLKDRIQRSVNLDLKKNGSGVLSIGFNTLDELDILLTNLSLTR